MNHDSATYRRIRLGIHRRCPSASKGKAMKYLLVMFVIAVGAAAIVYGEADDSPGGQLVGVLLVVGAIVLGVRMVRRSK